MNDILFHSIKGSVIKYDIKRSIVCAEILVYINKSDKIKPLYQTYYGHYIDFNRRILVGPQVEIRNQESGIRNILF